MKGRNEEEEKKKKGGVRIMKGRRKREKGRGKIEWE